MGPWAKRARELSEESLTWRWIDHRSLNMTNGIAASGQIRFPVVGACRAGGGGLVGLEALFINQALTLIEAC